MPLTFDAAGRLVPPGKVERVLDESFLAGTIPSWLTVSSGTSSFGSFASSRGYLQLTTGAVSGNAAQIQTTTGYNSAYYNALRLDAFGVVLDSDQTQLVLGLSASGSLGAYARQDYNELTMAVAMGGSAGPVNANVRATGEAVNRRNLSVMLLPSTKEMFILEDDQVMAVRTGATLTNGVVFPQLSVTTREAVAHNVQVSRLKLTLWHD